MEGIIVGVVTGIISSVIVSECYRRVVAEKERKFNFERDKERFSGYIKLVILELEFYKETSDKGNFLRILNKSYAYDSFVDENIDIEASKLIEGVKEIINDLKYKASKDIKIEEFELIKYNMKLYRAELDVLGIQLK